MVPAFVVAVLVVSLVLAAWGAVECLRDRLPPRRLLQALFGLQALLLLQLRVDRCDQVRPGGPVVVRLTEDGQPVTVVAGPAVQQPQPGAVPVEQLLDRLARRSC